MTRGCRKTVPSQSPRRISLRRLPPPTTDLRFLLSAAAQSHRGGGRSQRRRRKGWSCWALFPLYCCCSNVLLTAYLLCTWRFIQQVNQAAVTIQRWYRHHNKRKHRHQEETLGLILANKKKVFISPSVVLRVFLFLLHWNKSFFLQELEARKEEDDHQEQQRRGEDRKRIREEKAHLARLAAIQVQTFTALIHIGWFPRDITETVWIN